MAYARNPFHRSILHDEDTDETLCASVQPIVVDLDWFVFHRRPQLFSKVSKTS